jgi:hypothetical protein
MPAVILIEKTGEIKSLNIKNIIETDLYKKCGFKTNTSFEKQATWISAAAVGAPVISVELYAKTEGRANLENKYEFPPPVDKKLFFGTCLLLARRQDNEFISLSVEYWKQYYNDLMGGFEDLDVSEAESVEDAAVAALPKTKQGYVKDDFIVDDDEEEPPAPKKKRAAVAAAPKKRPAKKAAAVVAAEPMDAAPAQIDIYNDVELTEEDYE